MSDSPPNIFFRYVIIASSIFVITILALLASVLGDGQAPGYRWLNRHGTTLIVFEVIAIGVTGLLALVIDRRRILRETAGNTPSDSTEQSERRMTAEIKLKIEQLRDELRRHNRLYYVEGAPEISDLQFDQLLKQLEKLEADYPQYDSVDSPSHKVGGEPIGDFATIVHRVPMLSIDNAYEEDALREFDQRIREAFEEDEIHYTLEFKIDGVALALVYENGQLTQAVTRGDGRKGDDVTHNARTIGGVPLRLEGKSIPPILEIRGEALISNADFAHIRAQQEAHGETPFANSRNASAGSLKLRDPQRMRSAETSLSGTRTWLPGRI